MYASASSPLCRLGSHEPCASPTVTSTSTTLSVSRGARPRSGEGGTQASWHQRCRMGSRDNPARRLQGFPRGGRPGRRRQAGRHDHFHRTVAHHHPPDARAAAAHRLPARGAGDLPRRGHDVRRPRLGGRHRRGPPGARLDRLRPGLPPRRRLARPDRPAARRHRRHRSRRHGGCGGLRLRHDPHVPGRHPAGRPAGRGQPDQAAGPVLPAGLRPRRRRPAPPRRTLAGRARAGRRAGLARRAHRQHRAAVRSP